MVQYKLTYFKLYGLGEPIRMLFALAGVPFEEVRVARLGTDEWPAMKSTTPFGKLPVLEVDGKPLPQSDAILRYLANQFGFAGATSFEKALVDAVAAQHADFCNAMDAWIECNVGYVEGDESALYKEVYLKARAEYFPIYEKILMENSTGYFVGASLTWADLVVATRMELLKLRVAEPDEVFEGFPLMKAHFQKIYEHPILAQYLEKRPKYPY